MDEIIASMARRIIADIEYNGEQKTPEIMVQYLKHYHLAISRELEFIVEGHDKSMMTLIAIKQMIDTLSYTRT